MVFPEFVQTDERGFKSVSYGSFTPVIMSAIKDLSLRMTDIEARLSAAEAKPTTTVGGIGNTIVDTFTGIFGIFKQVETDTIQVKEGIEMVDSETGEVYCVQIALGEWKKTKGDCDEQIEPEPQPTPTPSPTPEPGPTPEPNPVPSPEPTHEPQPALEPQPEPQPAPEPETPPTPESAPQAAPEPEPEPAPAIEPAIAPSSEPQSETGL